MRPSPRDSSAFGGSARQLGLGRLAPDEDFNSGKLGSPRTMVAQQWRLMVMMGDALVGSCTKFIKMRIDVAPDSHTKPLLKLIRESI
jgi:hypothetical protein